MHLDQHLALDPCEGQMPVLRGIRCGIRDDAAVRLRNDHTAQVGSLAASPDGRTVSKRIGWSTLCSGQT